MVSITSNGKLLSTPTDSKGNLFGQLGWGYTSTEQEISPSSWDTFKKIDKITKPITHIACGKNHTLALTSDNIVYSFGNNMFSQLGQGEVTIKYDKNKVLCQPE